MFMGMFARVEYDTWLDRLIQERKPAHTRGLTECVRCGFCCARKTCVPTPDELPAIAEFLGIDVSTLVKKYMVGDYNHGHNFLRWANTAQGDVLGEFLDDARTFDKGDCLLFSAGQGCIINDVAPAEAQAHACWLDDRPDEEVYKSIEAWDDGDMEKFGVEDNSDYWSEDDDEW